jgi:hypothetical protein
VQVQPASFRNERRFIGFTPVYKKNSMNSTARHNRPAGAKLLYRNERSSQLIHYFFWDKGSVDPFSEIDMTGKSAASSVLI